MSDIIAIDTGLDFISETVSHVEGFLKSQETTEPISVIFPNRRSVRFFEKKLQPRYALNVNLYSISDFFKDLSVRYSENPPLIQKDIDRIFFIQNLLKLSSPELYQKLGASVEKSFPWCIRLSKLFNEFDRECVEDATSFEYVDEVVEEAREILKNLKILYKEYRKQMKSENISYEGDLFRRGAARDNYPDTCYFLCGFHHLTKSEESVFRKLFSTGKCTILFHSDLFDRHPHFSPYHFFKDWIHEKSWNKVKKVKHTFKHLQDIEFFESFDTHSMVDQVISCFNQLPETLRNSKHPQSVGFVLPNSGTLFPLITRLQGSALNITMGFPFEKTVFSRLLDILIELGMTVSAKGYYHKPFIKLLEHPLIRLIRREEMFLDKEITSVQKSILNNNLTYIHESMFFDDNRRVVKFLESQVIHPFINARSLKNTALALKHMVSLMINDRLMESRYTLERRMIQQFLDTVIPMLEQSTHADEKFRSPEVIYTILKQLGAQLSIPFEGNPLHGIQIMGTMESRLLSFDTLFILDVNEGMFPPDLKIDPLLPASLKKIIGIPTPSDREEMFKYQFYRMLDSARHIKLFYQKGESGDEKKIRSRFIEQLLLEREINMLSSSTAEEPSPVSTVREAEAHLIERAPFFIELNHQQSMVKPGFYVDKLNALLSKVVSPSLLDEYMKCPASFFFNRIQCISEQEAVEESQNPRKVGTAVHETLEDSFKPYGGKTLTWATLERIQAMAEKIVGEKVEKECRNISDTRLNLLKELAVFRLNGFFSGLKSQLSRVDIFINGLEQTLSVQLGDITMYGVVDRIDKLTDKKTGKFVYRVVDYKTGSYAKRPKKNMETFCKSFDFDDFSKENLEKLKDQLNSIQLPFYIYLLSQKGDYNTDFEQTESCLLMLGAGKPKDRELVFKGSEWSESGFSDIVSYLINHMKQSEKIVAFDSEDCRMCSYYRICPFTTHQAPSWG